MVAFNKFHCFVEDKNEGVHKLAADTLKVMLTNTAPVATNTIKANITEITAANGYTAGGNTISVTSSAQTSGTYKLICADTVFTASGGTMGPFRYAVFYNDTPTSPAKPLIGWWDYGSSITLQAGETCTVDFDQVNGVINET
jgi:hypothetical protein